MQYDVGQEVTLRLDDRVLKGRITELTLTSAQLTFPVPYTLQSKGTLIWPDGLVSPMELGGSTTSQAFVNLRIPLPSKRLTKKFAGESESADHRRTVRIDVSLPVRIADFTGTRRLMDGKTLNMSSGGALIVCEAALIVGRDYTLKLDLAQDTMAVKGRVMRRVGHNTYAVRFIADADTGHILMRKLFARMRTQEPRGTRKLSWNFRKS